MIAKEWKDDLGQTCLVLAHPPQRIVSLVPSISEAVSDIIGSNRLVGVTKFCIHPPDLQVDDKVVGGTKNPSVSKIKALGPDLILAAKEENRKQDIEELRKIPSVFTFDIKRVEDNSYLLDKLGQLLGEEEKGMALAATWQSCIASFQENTEPSSCLYVIWNKPIMVAGADTFINSVLDLIGLQNAISTERYPSLSEDQIQEIAPDYILLSSEPFAFSDLDVRNWEQRFPQSKVRLVDGEIFSWYGTRLLKKSDELKRLSQELDRSYRNR